MYKIGLLLFLFFVSIASWAQPRQDYYTASALDGKSGRDLELALKAIIYPHTAISYNELWNAFKTTDPGPLDSIPAPYRGVKSDLVYDMYAWMWQFPKFYSDNDHTQTGGINREHCVPNSWWGGQNGNAIAYTDLHHLVPSDGAANSAKGDHPLGEYAAFMTLTWPVETKQNANGYTYVTADSYPNQMHAASHRWKLHTGIQANYGGTESVFEPADEYKGDFARMYLYVVCAYEGELTWQTNYMFRTEGGYTVILPWAKDLLLKWHRQDPVSLKERLRNNAVESIQHNRNPFIDYPELVEYIWGNKTSEPFSLSRAICAYNDELPDADGKRPSHITFVLHGQVGKAFHGFTYASDSDGVGNYSSSDPSVAQVNATTGEVSLLAAGTATITYSVAETATYTALQEQYIIEVSP